MIEMCRHRDTRELVTTMMREALDVAGRLGCRPDISIERRLAGAETVGGHKPSTLQDLERGKPLELDVVLTAIIELADLTGADVPALRVVNALTGLVNRKLTGAVPA